MAIPTTVEVLEIAGVCQFLAYQDESKQTFFRGSFLRKGLWRWLYMIRRGIQWLYDTFPSDSSLPQKTSYLYWLCTPYIPQAIAIINGGGTGTIVNPNTGIGSTIQALFYDTTVDAGGTPPIINGQTSIVITDDFIFVNSITVVIDTIPIQYGIYTDRLSYTVAYSSSDATITIYNGSPNEGLQSGWNIEIRGLKFVEI